MKKLFACMSMVAALFSAQQAFAHVESGDAGYSLATAQLVAGGTTSISGNLGQGDAVDIYRFSWGGGSLIADTQGSANFDSMLFVFDLAGNLLAFNDDYPFCCQSLVNVNLSAGDYLLAIDNFAYNYGGNLGGFADAANRSGSGSYTIHLNRETAQVSEPASIAMLGLGLVGIAALRRRKSA